VGGRSSKRKGSNAEREFANITGGKRVPLSGAVEGYANDVILPNGLKVEVKRRKDMEKTLYDWILDERERPDLVAFRADKKPWVVAMTLEKFAELIGLELRSGKASKSDEDDKNQS
jgi:Holliday junction resolvase